jgi:bifunctional diaminopimelate decarboxylase / aspartate kinase
MKINDRWIVLKFGGTSVSSKKRWDNIAEIVSERLAEGFKPVVVCSALSGISNEIEKMLVKIPDHSYKENLERFEKRHLSLAKKMGLDAEAWLKEYFTQVAQLTRGAALVGEVTPRLHARVMAYGELLAPALGAAYLNKLGITARWQDVREVLLVKEEENFVASQSYLSANCYYEPDDKVREILNGNMSEVVLTQGFIARNQKGETVLLGRGGSDTSAAYLSAMLRAERCEIWTDVPGIYSANPRLVPKARLIKRLNYEEAQEISAMGAKVLHPDCIEPLWDKGIPLHIRCTKRPKMAGTIISEDISRGLAQVKAIVSKEKMTLISLNSQAMWKQSGFLAKVFGCFAKHGISIDLVSTSETNISVTLDNLEGPFHDQSIESLMTELGPFGHVRKKDSCASISLVGSSIRKILHKLGDTFSVFEEAGMHMVTQAANDLNMSFVVNEDQVGRLVGQLHQMLFEHHRNDAVLGKTWSEVFDKNLSAGFSNDVIWWRERQEELLALAAGRTPLYVYNEETLLESVEELLKLGSVERIFYSMKANPYPGILRLFEKAGLGFECVSPGEIDHLLKTIPGLDPKRIIFTPNFAPRSEYEYGFERGVRITLDNLFPLEKWPDVFRGRKIMVRIDPGKGRGHHDFVKTAGSHSKFGVAYHQYERLKTLAKENDVHIIGLHAHSGSGILTPDNWRDVASFLASLAEDLPEVKTLNLGGGLGVVEKPGQIALDMEKVDQNLQGVRDAFPHLKLWLEPGRFLVAQAGVLLASVTQLKQKQNYSYVGVDTGMNSLIRPALYGSYHHIINLSATEGRKKLRVNVVGPICESGDVLGHDRRIASPETGDVLLIATVGAYGHAMSSNYNMRPPAQEILLPARK